MMSVFSGSLRELGEISKGLPSSLRRFAGSLPRGSSLNAEYQKLPLPAKRLVDAHRSGRAGKKAQGAKSKAAAKQALERAMQRRDTARQVVRRADKGLSTDPRAVYQRHVRARRKAIANGEEYEIPQSVITAMSDMQIARQRELRRLKPNARPFASGNPSSSQDAVRSKINYKLRKWGYYDDVSTHSHSAKLMMMRRNGELDGMTDEQIAVYVQGKLGDGPGGMRWAIAPDGRMIQW